MDVSDYVHPVCSVCGWCHSPSHCPNSKHDSVVSVNQYGEEYILNFRFGVLATDNTCLCQSEHNEVFARAYWDELTAMTGCLDADIE
jgi:hypothetical protein